MRQKFDKIIKLINKNINRHFNYRQIKKYKI